MKTEKEISESIQQLADGELGFEERARLLRAVDADFPLHWREMALALIERDILSESVAAAAADAEKSVPVAAFRIALAACAALALFALGWLSRPQVPGAAVAGEMPPTEASRPALEIPLPSPEILRQANERLAPTGYEASMLTRYLRADLADGRQVAIPVSQFMLGYRGD